MATLRSVGTSALPRAGTTISTALTITTKETERQQIRAPLGIYWAFRGAAMKGVPREVVAGGEGGAAGRQHGLVGELLHLEQGGDLGDLLGRLLDGVGGGSGRMLLDGVGGGSGGAVGCGHG
jgi:hypothetical protein